MNTWGFFVCGLLQVQSVLGLELLECLYWRRGALLYMYCHTLHQRKQWIKKNKETFLKVTHSLLCHPIILGGLIIICPVSFNVYLIVALFKSSVFRKVCAT